jgi:Zn-dependent protease/CBS domain-containing protein
MPEPIAEPPERTGLPLGRIFGIPLYLHASWFIIFLLIAGTLAMQFKSLHPAWSVEQHWALGIATSLLFFASVVFHELSHSIVAKHYKIPVQSITLFVFGGLSRIARDPSNAKQEFNVAIAGPLSSLFLAGCFWLVWHYTAAHEMAHAAAYWLWWINLTLALFNLVPGFPLDGGRVLRSIVWGITGDFTRATRIAATAGKFFAYLMIFVGIWLALNGNWVNGVWIAFIGWFLLSAAQESYTHVALRNMLTGVRAQDIMTRDVATAPRDMSVQEYIHEVLRTGQRCHVAVAGETPVGLVTLAAARAVPRSEWDNTSIQAIMLPLEKIHAASPDEPALKILQRMQTQDINQMPVVSENHIVGMISRDSILRLLQTRLQLGHLS